MGIRELEDFLDDVGVRSDSSGGKGGFKGGRWGIGDEFAEQPGSVGDVWGFEV